MQKIYKTNITTMTLLFFIVLAGCHKDVNKTEKIQKERDNIINIESKIISIPGMLPVKYCAEIKIINDLLLVKDVYATHKGIYVYNKDDFKYLTSTGYVGKGPGEIGVFGDIVPLKYKDAFLITDFAKRFVYRFDIKNMLKDSTYLPVKTGNLDKVKPGIGDEYDFCWKLKSINDTIFMGTGICIRKSRIDMKFLAKYNILTKEIEDFSHLPSTVKSENKKKTFFSYDISLTNKLIIKAYSCSDLISFYDLNGNILYNIYGPGWGQNKNNKKTFFGTVSITDKYCVASYTGENTFFFDEFKRPHFAWPTKFIIFNLKGDYITTIDTKHRMTAWCVDEENKRIIAYFNDSDIEFGYFNIDFLDKL